MTQMPKKETGEITINLDGSSVDLTGVRLEEALIEACS